MPRPRTRCASAQTRTACSCASWSTPSREDSLAGLDAVTKGFRTGKAAAVLDPENLQLLDRSTEEITLPEPGYPPRAGC